ncbi:hypothetical protein DV738_g369, partial [Chaetothyriales sp. CBS 135597]
MPGMDVSSLALHKSNAVVDAAAMMGEDELLKHGISRTAAQSERKEPTQKELDQIRAYQSLVKEVNAKVEKKEFTPELLQKTAELLRQNPEYYTVWNHRRRIYVNEINSLAAQVEAGELTEEAKASQVLDFIQLDLQFLFPLLLKFPKCYWIWNHRLWLLEQATQLVPTEKSTALWTEELGLVGKMLTRDSRNFHGWGYRRMVITSLEQLKGESMARSELDYTTKMIKANLSNFSAWHNRSQLLLRILNEQQASDTERRRMLDDELELIHKALFDPYDQSLWFYHQNLMCALDPRTAQATMAPNLSNEERREYLAKEQEFVEELLEDADDCKWVFQALVEIALVQAEVGGGKIEEEQKGRVRAHLEKLKTLDPLRKGRWTDLEQKLAA